MRSVLFAFVCLLAGPLAAEVIGDVEYQLPNQGWQIANQLHSKKTHSTTIIYIPENTTRENTPEFFAAHVNNLPVNLNDTTALEQAIAQGLEFNFSNPQVTVTVLEQSSQSVLYEWSLSSSGNKKVHGWARAFSTPHETVMLNFQTEEIDKIDELRPIWVQLLENAKLLH